MNSEELRVLVAKIEESIVRAFRHIEAEKSKPRKPKRFRKPAK